MDNFEINDVDYLEQLKLKVTELKNKDSVYVIEISGLNNEDINYLYKFFEEKGINVLLVPKQIFIRELRRNKND